MPLATHQSRGWELVPTKPLGGPRALSTPTTHPLLRAGQQQNWSQDPWRGLNLPGGQERTGGRVPLTLPLVCAVHPHPVAPSAVSTPVLRGGVR